MNFRWSVLAAGLWLAATPAVAVAAPADTVRTLTGRVGPIIGSALACRDIARPRIQMVLEKFQDVIKETSATAADRDELTRLLDRHVAEGRGAVTSGRSDCRSAERVFADLEQSLAPQAIPAQAGAPAAPLAAGTATLAQAQPGAPVRGVTSTEIKFGMTMSYSGATKDAGRLMKLGIDAAFNRVNETGGINGRMLKLVTADDVYDPAKTVEVMKQLYDKEQVFGFIGSIGTANAAAAIPVALERRTLLFAPYTGANVTRRDPPDRYVFNYRPSYGEETAAIVRYLVKLRRLQPRQIAVFAQDDALGDAGYAGVAKAFRALGVNDAVLRVNYPRNTLDVDGALNQIRAQKTPIRAVIMVATVRAAAKFIEKGHDTLPGLLYASISIAAPSTLSSELMLLGPRYTSGVMVTLAVPSVTGYSTPVLDYKNALTKYFPGEPPDYTSLEGFIGASVLIEGLKRAGPALDTERLVDALEAMQNLDLGLGAPLGFSRADHQASHKIWGAALDENGTYQPIEME